MAGVEGSRRISVLHLPLTFPRLTHIHDFLQQHLWLSVLGLGQSRRGRKVMPSRAAPLVADQCLWICPRLPSDTTLRPILCQELTDNISAAESSPSPAVMNIVSLENSDTH